MYQLSDWWDNIPHAMREFKHFMCASYQKEPLNASTGYRGQKDDPSQWLSYGDAVYFAGDMHEGNWLLGFVPRPDDPFVIIDIDNKPGTEYSAEDIQKRDGLLAWALENTYVEKSSSGNGYHVVISGALPADINRGTKRGIEAYANRGFVVLTGNIVSKSSSIAHAPEICEWLAVEYGRDASDSEVNDYYTLDQEQINNPPQWELDEDQKFLDSVSGWKNEKNIRSWFYAEDTGPDGHGGSIGDLKLLQMFVKFSAKRKYPDESVMRMFLRSPRGRKLGRKNGHWMQYCMRTLGEAKAVVTNDAQREAENHIDFSSSMDKLLAEKTANMQQQLNTQSANAVLRAQGVPVPPVLPLIFKHHFPTKHASEVLLEPAIEWAVQGLFQSHAVNAIYGWSGVGKSFIALDLAAAVADGVQWFSYKTLKMPVLYVAIEGGSALNQRIGAFEKGNGHDYPNGVEFYRGKFKLRDADLITDFIMQRKAADWHGGMIIIDTLAKAMLGSDENSNSDMGEVIESLERLKEELNACVIIVHHSTKPDPKTGIAGSLRGAGALQAGIDGVFEVARKNIHDDPMDMQSPIIAVERFIRSSKVKEGSDTGFDMFELPKVMLDRFDNFGTQLSSCHIKAIAQDRPSDPNAVNSRVAPGVVAPTYSEAERARSASAYPGKTPREQKSAKKDNNHELLNRATEEGGRRAQTYGKAGAPPDVPCAPLDEVLNVATELKAGIDAVQDKKNLKKALEVMRDKNLIGMGIDPNGVRWFWRM